MDTKKKLKSGYYKNKKVIKIGDIDIDAILVSKEEPSRQKNSKRKSTMQAFVNNNARFCCQSKEKVLSSNTFGRMQIWTNKDKNGKPYWW